MPVMDNQRNTVGAEELERVSNKTIKNIQENEQFTKTFADYQEHKLDPSVILNLGTTPYSLQLAGAKDLPLNITQTTIENSMNPENVKMHGHTSGHDISPQVIEKLPELLRTPIMVLQDKASNNLTAILDQKDKQGQNIICRIVLDKKQAQYTVNRVSSMYGKRELANFINQAYDENRVVAVHKEKAEQLLHSIGCQSSKENPTISFDDSIAYTTANVKYPNQESERDQQQDKPLTGKEAAEKPSESTTKERPEYQINNPILASQVEKRQMKIAKLEDKNAILSDKIAKNETRIEKQNAKIEDAQKTKAYCKTLLESAALPKPLQVFFQSMMDRQETKIKKCNDKIGDLKDKNTNLTDKITENNKKISKHTTKIESLQKIDKFLTNMQSREGRRENFVQIVSDLRKISLERNSEKAVKLNMKIAQKEAALTKATSSVEKVQLRNQIAKLQLDAIEVNLKISKLTAMTNKLEKLTTLSDQQASKVIENATNSINKQLAANENMSEQEVVDTVVNETGKAITNNEIDNRTTPQNEEKSIIEKLNGEINDDLAFFGEVTYETAQHIKEAGYELKDNNLHKMPFEQSVDQETKPQQDKAEKQNENRADKQAEKAFDVAALCAAISHTFAENFNNQTGFVHTPTVFSSLAEKFNFNDVKSAVAVGILDRKNDPAITEQAKKWASAFPLTDILKPYAENKGTLPLEIKSGFLKVFAEKVGTWEQSRQGKDIAVFSRKDIIGSKPKSHDRQQQKPQHDKVQPKKNNPSL